MSIKIEHGNIKIENYLECPIKENLIAKMNFSNFNENEFDNNIIRSFYKVDSIRTIKGNKFIVITFDDELSCIVPYNKTLHNTLEIFMNNKELAKS